MNKEFKVGRIYFIKLGTQQDKVEESCLKEGKMVLDYREISHFKNYKELNLESLKQEIEMKLKSNKSATTNHANQIISFYNNLENTLWLTFANKKLYWGFVDLEKEPYQDDKSFTYRKMKDGWKCEDMEGDLLTFENISGALLKTQGFRGTICSIKDREDNFPIEEYTKRLIKGEKLEEVERAQKNKDEITDSMKDLLKMLHPKDFEYIVDLIFQYSGWKKLTPGAGVEKDLDLDLHMPLTGERAFVQIKSQTNDKEYEKYLETFNSHEDYDRFYYVYHTWKNVKENNSEKIHLLGLEQLSNLIVELGLITILMKKVS